MHKSRKALADRWCSVDFQRRGLGGIDAELRMELSHVVGIEGSLVAGAGNGDISKPGIEEVRVNTGIGIYEDALCSEALRAVAGDGIPVIKVTVLLGVEFYSAVVVK